jgi:hypothetical protein
MAPPYLSASEGMLAPIRWNSRQMALFASLSPLLTGGLGV